MLSVLIMVHVLVLVQESPPAETLKVVENPNFQAGSRFVFRNGLVGVVGVGQLDAPLSNLPAPDTWIAVARKTTRLRLDPTSDELASLLASAEAFRSALAKRRERDWQPQYDRINALMFENAQRGSGDDDNTIALASEYSRDCVRGALADFDAEASAFAVALAKVSGGEIDQQVGERSSKLLWRTRATHFLRDPAPIPVPPIVYMSLRDDVADVPVAEYVSDPSFRWLRGVLVRRNPHAKEVIDAWLGVKRLLTAPSDPAIRAVIEPTDSALRSLTQEMRMTACEGWRANIVFGATPSHPDRARYRPEMRRIAAQSQQHALALIAEIDRVVGTQRGSSGIEISRAVRTAVESVTGTLLDTEFSAEPISPEWPPQLGDAPQASMLGH
jgi:hypothetical protein